MQPFKISFSSTPEEAFAIVHVEPREVGDALAGERLRRDAGRVLGDMPVLLRCRRGQTILLRGPEHLYRYAGSQADYLPIVTVEPQPA